MAARDILTLKTSMAEGIIRLLYTIALILIGLGVLFGIARGAMILTHTHMHRPAITSDATPPSGAMAQQQQNNPAPQAQGDQNARPDFRGMGRDFHGWRRFHHHGPFGMMGRSPMFGLVVILGALLRGFIALLVIRVLAEIGLAILAQPRRAAT